MDDCQYYFYHKSSSFFYLDTASEGRVIFLDQPMILWLLLKRFCENGTPDILSNPDIKSRRLYLDKIAICLTIAVSKVARELLNVYW